MAKPAISPVRWTPTPASTAGWPQPQEPEISVIDVESDSPEDVVVDDRGRIWTGAIGGDIICIDPDSGRWQVVATTGGRPLGLEVLGARLFICDSERGLLQMNLDTYAIETIIEEADGVPLTFCSNVIVTEHTGGIDPRPRELYVSQSTTRFGYDHYKGDIIEHSGTGRLIRVRFDDDLRPTATVVINDLQFANGIVAHAGLLHVAETGDYRVRSYSPATGEQAVTIDRLPGFPDNASISADGEHMWLAMAGMRSRPLELLAKYPRLRKLIWRVPDRFLPEPVTPLWLLKIELPGGRVVADHRVHIPGFGMSTGVVETGGKVWISGIGSSKIAWFSTR
ncbi:UNVERIFIED_CONTAM: strictosidine synthase [Williamsia faeni]